MGNYLGAVACMLKEMKGVLDFTCFEMRDATQSWFAQSRPRELVQAAAAAAAAAGISFAGENALACWGVRSHSFPYATASFLLALLLGRASHLLPLSHHPISTFKALLGVSCPRRFFRIPKLVILRPKP